MRHSYRLQNVQVLLAGHVYGERMPQHCPGHYHQSNAVCEAGRGHLNATTCTTVQALQWLHSLLCPWPIVQATGRMAGVAVTENTNDLCTS